MNGTGQYEISAEEMAKRREILNRLEKQAMRQPVTGIGNAAIPKQGQVQNELNKIESSISLLEEIVSVVGQKFNFVMRPDYPQDCGTEKEQKVDVELGQVIQMYRNRINNMTNRLQVFIDRCEL